MYFNVLCFYTKNIVDVKTIMFYVVTDLVYSSMNRSYIFCLAKYLHGVWCDSFVFGQKLHSLF